MKELHWEKERDNTMNQREDILRKKESEGEYRRIMAKIGKSVDWINERIAKRENHKERMVQKVKE